MTILRLCEQRLMKPVLTYADFSIASVQQDQGVPLRGWGCPGRLFEGKSRDCTGTPGTDLDNQVTVAFNQVTLSRCCHGCNRFSYIDTDDQSLL